MLFCSKRATHHGSKKWWNSCGFSYSPTQSPWVPKACWEVLLLVFSWEENNSRMTSQYVSSSHLFITLKNPFALWTKPRTPTELWSLPARKSLTGNIACGFASLEVTQCTWAFKELFDKVCHKRDLKLSSNRRRGVVLLWIRNWLNSRKERAGINGQFSRGRALESGVPPRISTGT